MWAQSLESEIRLVQVVPEGATAGTQLCVDPDGPEGPLPPCLITVPAGLEPGMTFQFTLPPPAPVATVAVAVAAPAVAVAVAAPAVAVANPVAKEDAA